MGLGVLALALCAVQPAAAALKLCNRTSYILYAATATRNGQEIATKGWTRLAPGDCREAIAAPLGRGGVDVFARTSLGHSGAPRSWGGADNYCVKDSDFDLHTPLGSGGCSAPGGFAEPFAAINTHGRRDWTMEFSESTSIHTLAEAQLAGVKRLLKDNGYVIGAIDGAPDKATQAALTAFRKKMKFADGADNDALFNALETEALKSVSPAGLSACNDTTREIWAALARSGPMGVVSQGWWKIPAGSCFQLLGQPLGPAPTYLAVQHDNGRALLGGPQRFCVVGIEFEIHGAGHCAARGYGEAGFARLPVQGTGFVAHIGEGGLAAAHRAVPPK